MNNKKLKIAGIILMILVIIWAFIVFVPDVAAQIIPSEEIRSNIARIAVALIAIVIGYVLLLLAIPIVLKIGLLLVVGAVVYFAFRGLFKKSEPDNNNGTIEA
jgi:amino acid permease